MKNTLLFMLVVLVTLGVVLGGWAAYSASRYERVEYTIYYSGKVVFDSEEEYGEFKRVVGREDVSYSTIDILSSSPPIVAKFYQVGVPNVVEFPWGKVQGGTKEDSHAWVAIPYIFLLLVWFITVTAAIAQVEPQEA